MEQFGHCRQDPGGRCADGQLCSAGSFCDLGVCRCPLGYQFSAAQKICILSVVKAGASCHYGERCSSGSLCRFGVCMCAVGYQLANEKCVKLPGNASKSGKLNPDREANKLEIPAADCFLKGTCDQQENEFSWNSTETYGIGETENQERRYSIETLKPVIQKTNNAAPGQFCDRTTQCTGGSTCFANTCTCLLGTQLTAGECLDSLSQERFVTENPRYEVPKSVEQVPSAPETPTLLRSGMNGTSGVYQNTEYSTEPVILPCKSNSQCPPWKQCKRGVCRCRSNETSVGKWCIEVAHRVLPGQQCDESRKCVGESRCLRGICICTDGLASTGLECGFLLEDREKAQYAGNLGGKAQTAGRVEIGKSCLNGEICLGGSTCQHGFCSCGANEFIDETGACQKLYEADGSLGSWKHHILSVGNENSGNTGLMSLAETTQKSRPGFFYPVPDNKNAPDQRISGSGLPGEACTLGGLCWNGARCAESMKCECYPGYIAVDGYCRPKVVPLDGYCEMDEQCPSGAVCENSRCRCLDSYTEQSGNCQKMEPLEPKGDCTSLNQDGCSDQKSACQPGTGLCPCPHGQLLLNGICQPASKYPLNCNQAEDCHPLAYCNKGYCICQDASTMVAVYCVPQHEIVVGEDQEEEEPSSGENLLPEEKLMFGNKILESGNNFSHSETLGISMNGRNSSEVSRKIHKISRLSSGQSAEDPSFSISNSSSLESCRHNQQCPPHSYCMRPKCVCKIGFVAFNESCRAFRAPYTRCEVSDICAGNSLCLGGFCQCAPGRKLAQGSCVLEKHLSKLGQSCTTQNPQTHLNIRKLALPARICIDGTNCVNGWCTCERGTVPDPKTGTCISRLLSSGKLYRVRRRTENPKNAPLAVSENYEDCENVTKCFLGS
ncbi:unnamed protein product [Gongylonema pulchrum]|uniref:EGF-like domain-containing protein n=1 Tax=Gongylonema pulchrum TaxID=637853 RepID=A0A183D0X1_9BILA|nr:unnamed protein product [Gongylonema pulchrum]